MPNEKTQKPFEEMTPEELSKVSVEDLQKEVLRVELQTKILALSKTKKDLEDYEQREQKRRDQNKRRMSELASERDLRERITKMCRHRSGGTPKNILKGKGVGSFSLLTRTLMPDGFTILIQCVRCRLKMFTPVKPKDAAPKEDLKKYIEDHKRFQTLLAESIEEGLEYAEMRGPTFTFVQDGRPIIPERV